MMGMPLQFEANHGQADAQVKFLARGKGYTLFLTPTESVMVLQQRDTPAEKNPLTKIDSSAVPELAPIKQAVVRMKLEDANQAPAIEGMEKLPGIVNYFIGNDPAKWRTEIPTYAKVQYQDAYPGINLAYYGNQGKLEYDFIVAPGADPNQIRLVFEGASDIRTTGSGDLLLTTTLGEVRLQKPLVYQLEPNGHKTLVAGQYLVHKDHSPFVESRAVQIQVAAYDRTKALVIDPVLSYSTYLGGNRDEEAANAIAVDASGNAYVTGWARSTDFPTTVGAFQATRTPYYQIAFVTKLNPSGSALVYSTYLSDPLDPAGDGQGLGIAVDALGNAYITGWTQSNVFPTTPGAFQTTCDPNCKAFAGFVTKLNPTGSGLVYSTYLNQGYSRSLAIAVDGSGNACVTGRTHPAYPIPTTPGAFQTTAGAGDNGDAFVMKLNAAGTALLYSTYLGGSGGDTGTGIAVDSAGNATVTGYTTSVDFPTTPGAFQATFGGSSYDVFVTKLNLTGSGLIYSTFLGGSGDDFGGGIAVDISGNAYVTGNANSVNFPTTPGAFQPTSSGNGDAFVTKLNTSGSDLVYSTYLNGNGTSIAVDASGNAYSMGGGFIAKLNPSGSNLVYSTSLGVPSGSLAVDGSGNVYVAGQANSSLSTTPGVFQPTAASYTDAFVAKITLNDSPICSAAVANPNSLWQPDGRMVPIAVTGVTDPEGDSVTITVTTVTQDEPTITKSGKN
jgi:hypothetical protein